MVWSKTQAGRQEIKARSQVTGRARRTLLLLVDGLRGDAELLASVAGTTPADFAALAALGLIAPTLPAGIQALPAAAATAAPAGAVQSAAPADSVWQATLSGPASAAEAVSAGTSTDTPGRYTDLSRALTEMIASELGFRGFVLTMAVEKAATFHELRTVAERVITAIGDRKGPAQARAAHRTLFGE